MSRRFAAALLVVLGSFTLVALAEDKDKAADKDKIKTTELDLGGNVMLELVKIEPGEFLMGSELSAAEVVKKFNSKAGFFEDEHPQHRVKIAKGFFMGKFEVTRGQFRQFVQDKGYKTDAEKGGKGGFGWTGSNFKLSTDYSWRNAGFKQDDEHPVVIVSWNDAVAFCEWLGKKSGRKVRLPTEAEWEYAARGGTQTMFPWGNDPDDGAGFANAADRTFEAAFSKFNFASGLKYFSWRDGYEFTAPVGKFKANAFGLHDMIGNVWEWCSDWYGDYPKGAATDPAGPQNGAFRVLRGGTWGINPVNCRAASRYRSAPDIRGSNIGFRLVLDFSE